MLPSRAVNIYILLHVCLPDGWLLWMVDVWTLIRLCHLTSSTQTKLTIKSQNGVNY